MPPKASDIPDRKILEAVKHHPGHDGIGTPIDSIFDRFPDFPKKVIRAKLHAMLRKQMIHGCVCGCRGDFTLTPKGREAFNA